ncbi:MAG: glycosyltransferase, partial [Dysgonomonas sp.]
MADSLISIIVSTYNPDKFASFSANVSQTIGLDYEMIPIHNPGIMGICEAYNKGLLSTKSPYVCFCHDDILFHTSNWGHILVELFEENEGVGLVGCAGAAYKASIPSGWSSPQTSDLVKLNFIQTNKSGKSINYAKQNKTCNFEEVICLDGFWICAKKEITDQFRFDDHTFKGYHCYDVDYSLQVSTKYKVVVSYDILVEHLSGGAFSKEWLIETYKLHRKWNKYLPKYIGNISRVDRQVQEMRAFNFLSDKTIEFKILYLKLMRILFSWKLMSLVGFKKWCFVFKRT